MNGPLIAGLCQCFNVLNSQKKKKKQKKGFVLNSLSLCPQELNQQLVSLQEEVDSLETKLADEKSAHEATRDELETAKEQLAILTLDLENQRAEAEVTLEANVSQLQTEIEDLKQVRRMICVNDIPYVSYRGAGS